MATSGDASRPKFATANSAADGDYEVVAAVAGKKLRVIALTATALTTAGVVSLKSGAAGATIFAAHLALGTPLVAVAPGIGLCETAAGAALDASNATGVDSFVNVTFQEIEP